MQGVILSTLLIHLTLTTYHLDSGLIPILKMERLTCDSIGKVA